MYTTPKNNKNLSKNPDLASLTFKKSGFSYTNFAKFSKS